MNDFEDLLTALGETRARQIVASIAPASTLQAFDRHAAIVYACQLLVSGLTARSTEFKVAARYDVHIKTAQRRVKVAIAMGPR